MTSTGDGDARFQKGAVLRGKYRVERVLGQGGMGVVLLATHLRLEQRVAIKVLNPEIQKRPLLHARFAREARAASKLRNEHVVRVLDVDDTADGLPFLVMELLVGIDLEALLRRDGPLPAHQAADYVLQACEGIAEAHALGIVHRDLKPANLFLARSEDGDGAEVVKVLDFGIAKAMESEDDLSLTETSGVVGSPLYMSPEQLKGSRDLDTRTDIWSLGVVLYQLATGKLPFEATSATALAACIASEPPASIASVRPDLPGAYVQAVERCLRKAPAERFATVVELARAIAELAPAKVGAAERISGVARAAGTRRLSLAATQSGEHGEEAAGAERTPHHGRVTAELSADGEASATVGQPTDYGSEVARKPSVPAPALERRRAPATLRLAAVGLLALVVIGVVAWARSGAPPTSRGAAAGSTAAPPPAETLEAATPLVVAAPSAPSAQPVRSMTASAAKPAAPAGTAQSARPAAAPSSSAARRPAAGSPLDIELK